MTSDLLEVVGTALYGQQWQSDLARDLGLSSRAIRNWHSSGRVPTAKWRLISDLCRKRAERLQLAIEAIAVVT